VLTCTGVSFAHGSNDGQKGMGLIVLILVGIVPTTFALNLRPPPTPCSSLAATSACSRSLEPAAGTQHRPADGDTRTSS
jgi:PiT family inorganic phosphate transporter